MRKMQFMAGPAALAIVTLAVGGCASTPDRPVEQFARAETGIEFAEQSGAREHGTQALDRARDKMAKAQRAADEGEHAMALRLASEAELDAELAAAQASRGKAEDSLTEINDSIQTLRSEIARNAVQ